MNQIWRSRRRVSLRPRVSCSAGHPPQQYCCLIMQTYLQSLYNKRSADGFVVAQISDIIIVVGWLRCWGSGGGWSQRKWAEVLDASALSISTSSFYYILVEIIMCTYSPYVPVDNVNLILQIIGTIMIILSEIT